MRINTKYYLYSILAFLLFCPFYFCQAKRPSGGDLWKNIKSFGGQTGYKTEGGASIEVIIGSMISIVLSVLGIIFLCLVIYAGYVWFTASGDKGKVKKAQDFLRNSAIGLALVIAAYALTYYVIENFIKAAGLPT